MSSKLLRDVGEAVYGPRWQTELSRALGISDRTVRRWSSGTDDVPEGVYLDLQRIAIERAAEIDSVTARLNALIAKLARSAAPR